MARNSRSLGIPLHLITSLENSEDDIASQLATDMTTVGNKIFELLKKGLSPSQIFSDFRYDLKLVQQINAPFYCGFHKITEGFYRLLGTPPHTTPSFWTFWITKVTSFNGNPSFLMPNLSYPTSGSLYLIRIPDFFKGRQDLFPNVICNKTYTPQNKSFTSRKYKFLNDDSPSKTRWTRTVISADNLNFVVYYSGFLFRLFFCF